MDNAYRLIRTIMLILLTVYMFMLTSDHRTKTYLLGPNRTFEWKGSSYYDLIGTGTELRFRSEGKNHVISDEDNYQLEVGEREEMVSGQSEPSFLSTFTTQEGTRYDNDQTVTVFSETPVSVTFDEAPPLMPWFFLFIISLALTVMSLLKFFGNL